MMQQEPNERQAEYAELLKKPQWQKRRLQMLEAAGWKCVECGAEEHQLHVHHKRYIAGAKPWEYADEDLAVLCDGCHDKAHGLHYASPRAGARRRPPSAINTLLRLVVQHPTWAGKIPAWVVPSDNEEGLALLAVMDLMATLGSAPTGGAGALIERFRDTQHGEILARIVAELVDAEFDEAVVECLFADTLRKVYSDSVGSEIASLLQQDREAGLDETQRKQLSGLLLEKRSLAVRGWAGRLRKGDVAPWEEAA
jgi:hypothetical protein